jgi:hypothetical protein
MTVRVECRRCGWRSPAVAVSAAWYWAGTHAAATGCPVGEVTVPAEVDR